MTLNICIGSLHTQTCVTHTQAYKQTHILCVCTQRMGFGPVTLLKMEIKQSWYLSLDLTEYMYSLKQK